MDGRCMAAALSERAEQMLGLQEGKGGGVSGSHLSGFSEDPD